VGSNDSSYSYWLIQDLPKSEPSKTLKNLRKPLIGVSTPGHLNDVAVRLAETALVSEQAFCHQVIEVK
jgi:hypothetical protein